MIKANKLVICGDITYDDVNIYRFGEPGGRYIPNLFEKYQLYLKNRTTSATISMDTISLVRLRRESPKEYMQKIKRIVIIYGQTSFGPAWLIPENKYKELGIPFIFSYDYKDVEHCAFVSDEWIWLTKDELVASIEHY